MTDSNLLVHSRDARGVVTLCMNDAARFNALGDEMLAALRAALAAIAQDPSVRLVVLAAQGRAFCAGHNPQGHGCPPGPRLVPGPVHRCSQVMMAIRSCRCP
ncbi:enoyl-CoA hydratase/isomerase family protein [Comamonas sp. JC664]|uniref:enoyl-CoA hydratase/isomerase family protein n=1 Tax=Comamonas sp. JC664 TaxID=2801917 RepID=UPI003622C360